MSVSFNKYAISLSVVARLKNLEAKIPDIKKYMSQNPWITLTDGMILTIFVIIEGLPIIPLLLPLYYLYKRKILKYYKC